MPELIFKGKEFVFNHHLSVPFHPLLPDEVKSVGDVRLDGNLIIHADNLQAQKALLPMYADKIDCVFIDPPYNTGNESWSYNDNVNGPMIREWLNSNPIGIEDALRHDKWCAMMYPRLKLIHELLSDRGSVWITLDDNEVHHCRALLDEIFGADSCVGQLAWQKRTSRENRAALSPSIDHILCYSKALADTWRLYRNLLEPSEDGYANPDNDPKGPWKSVPFSAQGYRKNQVYPITTPTGTVLEPPKGRCWGATEPEFERLKAEGRVYWPRNGEGRPRIKMYPEQASGLVPDTLWLASEVGDTEDSKKLVMQIFSDREAIEFHAPKPHQLVQRVLTIATQRDSIVLDSFAGTGTTGHAVLAQNQKDGGNRRFILIENENYADTLTAERIRRVISGYEFEGTYKEELYALKLTPKRLSEFPAIDLKITEITAAESERFDSFSRAVKNSILVVYGEKTVTERAPGTPGAFTYCTLGSPVEIDALLTGEQLPPILALGSLLFHTATNRAFEASQAQEMDGLTFLGETDAICVWLIYKPDVEYLKTTEAALTLSRAKAVSERAPEKRHIVFAPSRFVSQRMLAEAGINVEFAPLPWSLFRIERP